MSAWITNFRPALVATAIVTVATGIAYPALVWGGAQILFPDKANGSIALHDGKPVGSYLIAQGVTDSALFHPRPSAAGSGYLGEASSGSNAGPLNKVYVDTVVPGRVAAYRADNGLGPDQPVPASAVSASGSGLDPDITVDDALLQVPRIARVRKLDKVALEALVWSTARDKGWHADSLRPVNVLALNLSLEEGHVH
ncbi:MAG: potassium-transporting ATPase subunit C [Fibrobacterota bacterium]